MGKSAELCWLVGWASLSWQTIGSQWLGEHRAGVRREHGIVEKFPDNGLPVIWRQPLGDGYSGPAVANGRVLVMDREAEAFAPETAAGYLNFVWAKIPGRERLICLEESTGKNSGNRNTKVFIPQPILTRSARDARRRWTAIVSTP